MRSLLCPLFVLVLATCKFADLPPLDVDATQPPDAREGYATLTVLRTGSVLGTVTTNPTGISCGDVCVFEFPVNTQITLSASPDVGAEFGAWSGACSGTSMTCTFLLGASAVVTAAFEPATYTVTAAVGGNGTGTVTSSPAGISCPGTCDLQVAHGTMMSLTAQAASGATFVGWSGGGCSGLAPCSFTVTADATINVSFALDNSLIVTRTGNGNGRVTSTPSGIDCPGDCSQTFSNGQDVLLTAVASADSVFAGWSGAGCGGQGTCSVTMDMAKMVSAEFVLRQHTLSVTNAGAGMGVVTANVGGLVCPGTCSVAYNHGQQVTLSAAPNATSLFGSWSGDCSGGAPCVVTIDAPKSVTATFLDSRVVSVVMAGSGTGRVISNPPGIDCGTTCSARFAVGANVTLTATPDLNQTFAGWSGSGCTGTMPCALVVGGDPAVTATFHAPNVAFVTSTTQNANFGGVAGADAICASRAASAGLSGTYRAWVSSSSSSAMSRLGTASGWVRRDGRPVAASATALLAGRILYPIALDEMGGVSSAQDPAIWTGTLGTGAASGALCMDWTVSTSSLFGSSGRAFSGTNEWTSTAATPCAAQLAFYCFQVDRISPVTVPVPTASRRAFVSNGLWTPGGGIAAADTVCANEAAAAGLSGVYRAALPPSSTASAMSRFNINGDPWYRVDDVRLTATPSDFFTTQRRDATLNVTASGSYVTGSVWTGGFLANGSTTATDTCSHWSTTSGSGVHVLAERGFFGGPFTTQLCSQSARVYCLQQ